MRKFVTIDFETLPIEKRPHYPPKPVGVAITLQSGKSEYLAWGHPTGNNTTMAKAKRILKDHYANSEIVMHHAKFDLEVGEKFLGLPLEPKHGFHCTMILAFLFNPRAWSLKLKILAKEYLGIMPNEQLKLKNWILDNVKGAKKSKTKWGQYIYLAPGGLVGQYAKADTKMTKGLFKKFISYIILNNMSEQYSIEKQCAIEAIKMERVGIMIDVESLDPELVKAQSKLKRASNNIKKKLGDINLNSPAQKIEAFERLGLVDKWEYGEPSKKTGKVNPKTGIESLMNVCTDTSLVKQLEIYSKYTKLISTYMIPWLNSARENDGRFYPWINTIKGDNDKGTYTGRFSSNFQQVPKEPDEVFKGMPFLRKFILPDNGHHTLLNRDYCFSDDTEVLTSSGWRLFKDLDPKHYVAQYSDGIITYAKPLAYQKLKFKGDMVNIHSRNSCNLMVSPDHDCLQLLENGTPIKIKAKNYRIGHYKQVVSGNFISDSTFDISGDAIKLIVAIQADCALIPTLKGHKAKFYLKKGRKIERLIKILDNLGIDAVIKPVNSKEGFMGFNFFIPDYVERFLDYDSKVFSRWLLTLSLDKRLVFLKELGKWDGHKDVNGWAYYNTKLGHFDMLQEMCIISGVKSVLRYVSRSNRKRLGRLCMTVKSSVDTKMFKKEAVNYNGYMYCVTMPQGTVLVRREGNACITGNCGQELRILAHLGEGKLYHAYNNDPYLDGHLFVQQMMLDVAGKFYPKPVVKGCNFLVIYGGGANALSKRISVSLEEAQGIFKVHGQAVPEVNELKDELRLMSRRGEVFVTAGGRIYDFEEGFEYVALNTLIQGSAADHAKRGLLNISKAIKYNKADARIMLQVHDEFMLSACAIRSDDIMKIFKTAMELDELFDVPMLTDGKMGANWGSMTKYKD